MLLSVVDQGVAKQLKFTLNLTQHLKVQMRFGLGASGGLELSLQNQNKSATWFLGLKVTFNNNKEKIIVFTDTWTTRPSFFPTANRFNPPL